MFIVHGNCLSLNYYFKINIEAHIIISSLMLLVMTKNTVLLYVNKTKFNKRNKLISY